MCLEEGKKYLAGRWVGATLGTIYYFAKDYLQWLICRNMLICKEEYLSAKTGQSCLFMTV